MYDAYLSGRSLDQVAAAWGVTRQSVYDIFKRRDWPLRSKVFKPTVEFNGQTYSTDPDGYYRATSGDREWLHHAVWRFHNGAVPPGRHIHHRDEDKANNEIGNLLCLSPSAHGRIHKPRHAVPLKTCRLCGSPLIRKQSPGGQWETPAAVARRVYCDRTCADDDRRGRPSGWSSGREEAART